MTSPEGQYTAHVAVSWDGTGAFDGPYDVVTTDVDSDPGVVIAEGRDGAQQLAPPKVNSGAFELINESARYSQENASSPLYQRVEPNKPVGYGMRYGARGLYREHRLYREHDYYRGRASVALGSQMIDELVERSIWGDRRVGVTTIGVETLLTRAPVTVALMTNVRIDQCFTALLNAAGWPSSARRIDVSDTTLLYWWCDARDPWSAMLELLASEGPGTFGVDRDGVFYFESRNHRTIESASTTSQATYYDRVEPDALWYTELDYNPAFKNIRNRATYRTRRRSVGALQKVWEYGTTLTLTAGQSISLAARPADPFTGALSPALTTDYVLTAGSATVTLTGSSGFVAFITITAGAGGATINGPGGATTGLQLRAQPLTVLSETTVSNTVDASASIERYSPIPGADIPLTLEVAGWPEIDAAAAQAVCNAWVLRQMWPRPTVTFVVPNADAAHVDQIMRRRVSDRLTLVQAHSGLDADVWINSLELRLFGFDGARAELVVGAEKCDTLSGAVWDLSLWNDPSAVWGV